MHVSDEQPVPKNHVFCLNTNSHIYNWGTGHAPQIKPHSQTHKNAILVREENTFAASFKETFADFLLEQQQSHITDKSVSKRSEEIKTILRFCF